MEIEKLTSQFHSIKYRSIVRDTNFKIKFTTTVIVVNIVIDWELMPKSMSLILFISGVVCMLFSN